jgi:hypothetical protein
VKNILVVDVSGSMLLSGEEIATIEKQYEITETFCWDTAIVPMESLESIHGGGGTDADVLREFTLHSEFDMLYIYSDGMANWENFPFSENIHVILTDDYVPAEIPQENLLIPELS